MTSLISMNTRLMELDLDRFEVENAYTDWVEEMLVEFTCLEGKTSPGNAAFFARVASSLESLFAARLTEIKEQSSRADDDLDIETLRQAELEHAHDSRAVVAINKRYFGDPFSAVG